MKPELSVEAGRDSNSNGEKTLRFDGADVMMALMLPNFVFMVHSLEADRCFLLDVCGSLVIPRCISPIQTTCLVTSWGFSAKPTRT